MVMSFPSPHGPEDAAPQFQKMFLNEKGHRFVIFYLNILYFIYVNVILFVELQVGITHQMVISNGY